MLHRDIFVRLVSFKLKEVSMILSELCGETQPGGHCLSLVLNPHIPAQPWLFFFVLF